MLITKVFDLNKVTNTILNFLRYDLDTVKSLGQLLLQQFLEQGHEYENITKKHKVVNYLG